MSAHSRRKGRRGENEAVKFLGGDAKRISEGGRSGPDLEWRGRFGESRRRSRKQGYESMNKITAEFEGDTSFYMTRLDRGQWVFVAPAHVVLDMLDEAHNEGFNLFMDRIARGE